MHMDNLPVDPDPIGQPTGQRPRARCPAPFLSKTYDLIERSGSHHIISWNGDGTRFIVWSPQEFSQFLLPRYFKHSNFSSFIRQLNTYGFKKSASDRWEFHHEKFRKGKRHLIAEIIRRRCMPSIFPSFLKAHDKGTGAPTNVDNHLIEENKSLQEKNSELQLQITQLKALEMELLDCLSIYMEGNNNKNGS
ncbi:heat stress transcription factor B-2a-like [Magnolia sinica]|uniref:heat stress transcription factor B-2a-like n=1 Tax=Magnolia sinica TaxID=86752 RepID=UPI002657E64F|nr:heat stress transcription factor B-2a-like [Magnolia sinica]